MRTIKFRGRSRKTGEWLVGDLLQVAKEVFIAPSDGDWFDFIPWSKNNVFHLPSATYQVIPDTVGQFTGMHDADGKEIYEGDILIEPNIFELPRHVFWDDRFARWGNISPTTHGYIALHDYNRPEIIGNIHDNPELLKQND